jgi:hypothetical protein
MSIPRLENVNTDALSRLPQEVNMKDPSTPSENVFLMEFLNTTPVNVENIKQWTLTDNV